MSYIVLARRWRPQDFDGVVGQEHITTTLKNAISQNKVAHAYIFTGPRGIGKTSVARIFAKSLNCEKGPTVSPCEKCPSCANISSGTSMDVIEIDGASNNSVDQIRELRENIKFMPSYGRHKIYIIDEVHMLSIGAFNALLKTLEEPPGHAKFIFATTNPEKVPSTVLSRCQRFDFRRIPLNLIISKLKKISEAEALKVSEEALFSIAKAAEGSMRDAESILDQLSSFCEKKIGREDVVQLLGMIEQDALSDIGRALAERDTHGLLLSVDRLMSEGKDMSQALSSLIEHVRNIMVLKVSSDAAALIDLPAEYIEEIRRQSGLFSIEELLYIFQTLFTAANQLRRSDMPRFIVEAAFIKLSHRDRLMPLAEIVEKISRLDIVAASSGSGDVESNGPAARIHVRNDESAALKNNDAQETAGALTLDEVKRLWPQVVEAVKQKKISVGSYLAEGKVIAAQDDIITLGFARQFNFHKEALEEKNNAGILEDAAGSIMGRKVRFRLTISEPARPAAQDDSALLDVSDEPAGSAGDNSAASDDSIIQSAIEMFGGKIVNGGRNKDRDRRAPAGHE